MFKSERQEPKKEPVLTAEEKIKQLEEENQDLQNQLASTQEAVDFILMSL